MFVDRGRRLSTAIALRTIEIQRGHAMLTVSALKCGATVQRFSCVISHVFIVVLQGIKSPGQEVCNLWVEPLGRTFGQDWPRAARWP
jgi:hypothetical protein